MRRHQCAVGRGAITAAMTSGSLFARMPCGSLTSYAMMSPARTSRSPVAPATTPAPEMAISSTVDALECTGTCWPGSIRNTTTRASAESWMSAVAGRASFGRYGGGDLRVAPLVAHGARGARALRELDGRHNVEGDRR